jgi:hypothetical protein
MARILSAQIGIGIGSVGTLTLRTPLQCCVHSSIALGSERMSRLNVDRERGVQRNGSTDAFGEATA